MELLSMFSTLMLDKTVATFYVHKQNPKLIEEICMRLCYGGIKAVENSPCLVLSAIIMNRT